MPDMGRVWNKTPKDLDSVALQLSGWYTENM